MEQPELGKKIAELRKAKRWTQEELVEKCNISVRTIQRIEAGDVTPRDYTVKTILGAMDYDLDQIKVASSMKDVQESDLVNKFFLIGVDISPNYATRNLNIAFVFGILYFILRFVEGAAEFARFMEDDAFGPTAYTIVKGGLMLSAIGFMRGFIIIGALFENQLLKMAASILIGINIFVLGLDIFTVYNDLIDPEIMVLIYSLSFGAIGIIFGYALTRLEGRMGRVSKLAGAIEIMAGLLSITVILFILGQFVIIPAELLEIMLIYRAMEILRKDSLAGAVLQN